VRPGGPWPAEPGAGILACMTEPDLDAPLSRTAASEAVGGIGWRYLLGTLALSVPVVSMAQATEVAATATAASGTDADGHLRMDLRPDRVELSLQTAAVADVTGRDTQLARRISAAVDGLGLGPAGATSAAGSPRPVEMLEMAIDALDIPAIRPFWKAVMAYADEPGRDGPYDAIVDPAGQLPAIWFQQMDAPRPQRNRVHFDITVAHDEAEARVRAALAAGGRLVDDSYARSFWVLADAEGNEVCVCTWTDRDERERQ
jgi:4a-hydroxytetrahydrobiopterin dehydratase